MFEHFRAGLFLAIYFCFSDAIAIELVMAVSEKGDNQPIPCNAVALAQRAPHISLKRAIELVNCRNWAQMAGDDEANVRIELESGVYRLGSTLELAWGLDSRQNQLIITGPGNGDAVISGARKLSSFQRVTHHTDLARLPAPARDHVLMAELKSVGVTDLRPSTARVFGRAPMPVAIELFFSGQAMKVATWPNSGWGRIRLRSRIQNDVSRRLQIDGRKVADWLGEPGAVATGFFAHNWAEESIPIASVEPESNQIVLSAPGPRFGINDGMRVRIENALSELDQPGEWFLDRKHGLVYFWPPRPIQDGIVEVSVLDSLLRIKDSRNIRISRLRFDMARGDAVQILNSNNVVIKDSVFRNAGNRAVLVVGGTHSGVVNAEIEHVGEGGVVLRGGDRRSLKPANLFVKQSRIRQFNRLSKTYRPAVQIDGVGNQMVGNVISDAPHSAIIFRGNDHYIAYNNISRVVMDTDDAGAIYTGRDWTARGTVIDSNYLHDIGSPGSKNTLVMGVYLDDQSSGTVVRGNIFARVQQPVFIGGGRDNLVEHNLFFHSPPALHLDARGLTWQRARTLDPRWDLQSRLAAVPYKKPPYSNRYPHLAAILADDLGAPKYNVASHNLVIDSGSFEIVKGANVGISLDSNYFENESVFAENVSPQERLLPEDFEINPLSAILIKNGFNRPKLEQIAR